MNNDHASGKNSVSSFLGNKKSVSSFLGNKKSVSSFLGNKKSVSSFLGNKDLVILIVLIAVIWGGLAWQEKNQTVNAAPVSVKTDKIEYAKNDPLKVTIKNNLEEKICFSSCYPYYWERKDGGWDSYSYSQCQESNVNDMCVGAHQSKFFQIDLSLLSAGIHRMIVPVCLDCKDKDSFREDDKFYSNEFLVK